PVRTTPASSTAITRSPSRTGTAAMCASTAGGSGARGSRGAIRTRAIRLRSSWLSRAGSISSNATTSSPSMARPTMGSGERAGGPPAARGGGRRGAAGAGQPEQADTPAPPAGAQQRPQPGAVVGRHGPGQLGVAGQLRQLAAQEPPLVAEAAQDHVQTLGGGA